MEYEAEVNFGSGRVWYKIVRERPGIYLASLLRFDSVPKPAPPKNITLIRGLRTWTGSYDNSKLVNDLGELIDKNFIDMPADKSKTKSK